MIEEIAIKYGFAWPKNSEEGKLLYAFADEYATSKSKGDNKLLLEEIEKLKGEESLHKRQVIELGTNYNALESQLAEAKKEIEEYKIQLENLQERLLLRFDDLKVLQSQLQESEERNKQLVEALEEGFTSGYFQADKFKQILKDNNKQK